MQILHLKCPLKFRAEIKETCNTRIWPPYEREVPVYFPDVLVGSRDQAYDNRRKGSGLHVPVL